MWFIKDRESMFAPPVEKNLPKNKIWKDTYKLMKVSDFGNYQITKFKDMNVKPKVLTDSNLMLVQW